MKIVCTYLLVFITNLSFAQMVASVHTAIFQEADNQYVELYTGIPSHAVVFVEDAAGQQQAQVEMICVIKKDSSIVAAEKYLINSPKSVNKKDFWDIKRYALAEGNYNIEVSLFDQNDTLQNFYFTQPISIEAKRDRIEISDLVLCSDLGGPGVYALEKYGFSFEKLPYDLCSKDQDMLSFFGEFYGLNNIEKDEIVGHYQIYEGFSDDINTSVILQGYKKMKIDSESLVFVESVDLSDVLSGEYHLRLDIIDRDKKVLASQAQNFQVYHPESDLVHAAHKNEYFESSFVQDLDIEKLDYSLKAISPQIAQNSQGILVDLIKNGSILAKRYFLFSYFIGQSSEHPEKVYKQYMEVAKAVDKTYRDNVGFGFESDRGFIFLKYGRPNDKVVITDEPSAPPYEIWIYENIAMTNQTNVKFLFYNPSLAGNNYQLLHSTCRGERNNPSWELDLYGDALGEIPNNRIDNRNVGDNYLRNAREYFSDF